MNKFNLIDEPWIPCLMRDGTIAEFGLRETLLRADEIKEITDDSPLVVISLHRLLLAILHRNFGPKNFEEWKNLWRRGFWNADKLNNYFDTWQSRFNLFDEERPFYQYPKVAGRSGTDSGMLPIETLMQEKATGANATLFDHSFRAKQTSYSPAVAARYLVARHGFSLAGGVSYPFNLSNGLLVKGFSVLAVGDNLFQTLALNLVIYYRDKPMRVLDEDGVSLDKPFWEREILEQATENDKDGTIPFGYLDYLTWQSRRMKLIPEPDFQSVKFCQLQQNFKIKEDLNIFDPFKVYTEGERGLYALDFRADKALWRNSHTIFHQKNSDDGKSNLFKHLSNISSAISAGEIEGRRKYSFSIIGIINDQASVETWMHETLPISLDYFDDNDLTTLLETAIQFSKDISDKLRGGIKELAKSLETNEANFPAMSVYWATLELEFQKLLINLPEKKEAAMREWFKTVYDTANDAFDKTANSLSGSAMEQKAIVNARNEFHKWRNVLLSKNSEYRQYLPERKAKGGSE